MALGLDSLRGFNYITVTQIWCSFSQSLSSTLLHVSFIIIKQTHPTLGSTPEVSIFPTILWSKKVRISFQCHSRFMIALYWFWLAHEPIPNPVIVAQEMGCSGWLSLNPWSLLRASNTIGNTLTTLRCR